MSEIIQDKIDMDGDGKTSKTEVNIANDKFKNRRRMAWLAMISMIWFTALLLTNYISIERIKAIESIFSTFYIAMASVVGAYMGFTAWEREKNINA